MRRRFVADKASYLLYIYKACIQYVGMELGGIDFASNGGCGKQLQPKVCDMKFDIEFEVDDCHLNLKNL